MSYFSFVHIRLWYFCFFWFLFCLFWLVSHMVDCLLHIVPVFPQAFQDILGRMLRKYLTHFHQHSIFLLLRNIVSRWLHLFLWDVALHFLKLASVLLPFLFFVLLSLLLMVVCFSFILFLFGDDDVTLTLLLLHSYQ